MVQVVQGGEESSLFGIFLFLNFTKRIIEPWNVVLIFPAVWILGIQPGGLIDKFPTLIQGCVDRGVSKIKEEWVIPFLSNKADGIIGNQLGGVNTVLTAFNELMVSVPGVKERPLAVAVVVISHGSGETAITLIKPEIIGSMIW